MKKRKPIAWPPLRYRIGKLQIEPGDMLVLQTDLLLDRDQIQTLRDRANEQFAALKVQVAILTAGMQLAVLRKGKLHRMKIRKYGRSP
jgi:hypothetical protein